MVSQNRIWTSARVELLGASHVQAHRWLEVLKLDSVLKQVSVGTRHKASEYRYIADLCEHLQRPGKYQLHIFS